MGEKDNHHLVWHAGTAMATVVDMAAPLCWPGSMQQGVAFTLAPATGFNTTLGLAAVVHTAVNAASLNAMLHVVGVSIHRRAHAK